MNSIKYVVTYERSVGRAVQQLCEVFCQSQYLDHHDSRQLTGEIRPKGVRHHGAPGIGADGAIGEGGMVGHV